MTVIECPKCGSKFKINKDILDKQTIKMRCSVCSHVFTYPPAEPASIEKDFDLLIGTNDGELEEKPLQDSLKASLDEGMPQGITETMEDTEAMPEAKESGGESQPESVIREIDSILGGGSEVVSGDDGVVPMLGPAKGKSSKLKVTAAVAALVVIVLAGAWLMRDFLPFIGKHGSGSDMAGLEKGPLFSIPDSSITYETLTNNSEGSVLVIKGVIRKLTTRPLKSIMVEARVYGRGNNLVESRNAYAGIIPESSELMQQKSTDIDTLLTAEPRTLGVLETSPDIPFAVAFFGKSARESYSFQVEVKEFHWK